MLSDLQGWLRFGRLVALRLRYVAVSVGIQFVGIKLCGRSNAVKMGASLKSAPACQDREWGLTVSRGKPTLHLYNYLATSSR